MQDFFSTLSMKFDSQCDNTIINSYFLKQQAKYQEHLASLPVEIKKKEVAKLCMNISKVFHTFFLVANLIPT